MSANQLFQCRQMLAEQTLSKIGGSGKSRAAKYRKLKREAFSEKQDQQADPENLKDEKCSGFDSLKH